MLEGALGGPHGAVGEGTDGAAFDLFGEAVELVDLFDGAVAGAETLEQPVNPADAFAAGGALAAALVVVEACDTGHYAEDVDLFIHDDDSGGTEAGAFGFEGVEIHEDAG